MEQKVLEMSGRKWNGKFQKCLVGNGQESSRNVWSEMDKKVLEMSGPEMEQKVLEVSGPEMEQKVPEVPGQKWTRKSGLLFSRKMCSIA